MIYGSNGVIASHSPPYCYTTGFIRWNGNTQQMEVETAGGSSWTPLPPATTMIGLEHEVQSVLNWARAKMVEEASEAELMEKHPGLKDAKEKYLIMKHLVKQEEEKKDGT